MQLIQANLQQYLDWWLTGLRACLPDVLRRRLVREATKFTIHLEKDGYLIHYQPLDDNTAGTTWKVNPADTESLIAIQEQIAHIVLPGTQTTMILPRHRVLKKTITLPLAAKPNLNTILKFELEKHTPFSHEHVYYSWEIIESDPKRQKMKLNIHMILKDILDKHLVELQDLNLKVYRVIPEGQPSSSRVNLLSNSRRIGDNLKPQKLIMPAITVLLILTVLYLPLIRQDVILDDLSQKIAGLKEEAATVQGMLDHRNTVVARIQFLNEERASHTPAIDIVDELTSLLPDDTWIERLIINENEIQINGESASASNIIQQLENSDHFANVQFRAPVVKNSDNNKDRFQMVAELIPRQLR